jgi:uncharacterized protein
MATPPAPDGTGSDDVQAAALAAALARAEAAEARAAALEARAEALRLAAEAAAGSAGSASDSSTGATTGTSTGTGSAVPTGTASDTASEVPPGTSAGTVSAHARDVAAAYAAPGAVLPLGVLVEDGEPVAGAVVGLPLRTMNRHGLVAGATGTGKTRTLQLMAEGLSAAGVPVFVTDVKGDLSGLAAPGAGGDRLLARTTSLGQDWSGLASPVEPFTLGGVGTGTPIRTTVTDFGPLLLSKVLGLNATQESSLGLVFHWADTHGLALLDLADLQATIAFLLSDDGKPRLKGIGGLSSATAGVILREVVALQAQGGDVFFGEPAFSTADLLRTAPDGRGVISALELPGVGDRPALFSTFLMWLLAELFSELPEVGDADRPRLVFFFDEAHLLFTDASDDFLTQVTQTVRLIRSKGVGIVFVTQTPKDVPTDVLAQLGSRVQHALRAHTPADSTALRATVRTFPHSGYDLEELLTTLATGEAVVTVLSEEGAPTPVAWTRLYAPRSSMEPLAPDALAALARGSALAPRYATAVDRESARELLAARTERAEREQLERAERDRAERERAERDRADAADDRERERARRRAEADRPRSRTTSRSGGDSALDAFLRSAGSALGREITRTVLGTRRR